MKSKRFKKIAEENVIPVNPVPVADASSINAEFPFGTVTFGNAQDQGRRNYQEDSFGFSDISLVQKGILAVLADGMGGLKDGKAVSSATVSGILDKFNRKPDAVTTGATLRNLIAEVNIPICDTYCSDGTISSGSTVVTAHINNGYLHWACVGDSRLYIKRHGRLYQINEDHDYLNQLLDIVIAGKLTVEDAYDNVQKDSLAACIGKRDLQSFDYSKRGYALEKGDIVVLCSDGIYNALSVQEMCDNITEEAMPSCERIISLVASKGIPHQDNNTIIVMSYR